MRAPLDEKRKQEAERGAAAQAFAVRVAIQEEPEVWDQRLTGWNETDAAAPAFLDRLQARGLLVRHASPTDRRTHALALTPNGARALAKFTQLVRRHEKHIASGLSTAETRALIALLEKVRAGARSL